MYIFYYYVRRRVELFCPKVRVVLWRVGIKKNKKIIYKIYSSRNDIVLRFPVNYTLNRPIFFFIFPRFSRKHGGDKVVENG